MAKSCFLTFLSCAIVGLFCNTTLAARWISVQISLNGEVILEGSDSDNGETDADTIWNSLKRIKLREADAFKKLEIAPKVKEYKFDLDPPKKGHPWPIKIDASFGGVQETRFVTIKRVEADNFGGQWLIDPTDVDGAFDYRMIVRSEAGHLRNPGYSELAARFNNKTTVVKVRNLSLSSIFSLAMTVGWLGSGTICFFLVRRWKRQPVVNGRPDLDLICVVSWGIFSFFVASGCLFLYLTEPK